MTIEAKKWFLAQNFRLERLKERGQDAGQARMGNDMALWDTVDEQIAKEQDEKRKEIAGMK